MAEIEGEFAERRRDQDEILIGALASGATDEVAAELAGCSARTVRRRRHDDRDFHQAVKQRRAERTAALTGRFVDLADRAVDVLVAALDDESRGFGCVRSNLCSAVALGFGGLPTLMTTSPS